jgi:hypothetical protein
MGFDLYAESKDGGDFHFNAFAWPRVLGACGYLFPYVSRGGIWFHAPDADPLVTEKDPYGYRLLGSNDDFRVSAADARLMARCARNYAALNDPQRAEDARPDPATAEWVGKMAAFAEWAEASGGFSVG